MSGVFECAILIESLPASLEADTVKQGVANTKQIIQRIKSDVHDAQVYQRLQRENAAIPKVNMASLGKAKLPPLTFTMLNDIGGMGRPISPSLAASWKAEIKGPDGAPIFK